MLNTCAVQILENPNSYLRDGSTQLNFIETLLISINTAVKVTDFKLLTINGQCETVTIRFIRITSRAGV